MNAELKQMMSDRSYQELQDKVKDFFGEKSFPIVFPAIEKALVDGGREEREKILINLFDMDTCRVCTTCGAIMSEGWYLNDAGYACSDECAAKSEGITMEEFDKFKIYKGDIQQYLDDHFDYRNADELTKEECEKILEKIKDDLDWYYTEWY